MQIIEYQSYQTPFDVFTHKFANTFGFRFSEQIFPVSPCPVRGDKKLFCDLWTGVSFSY